MKHGTTILLACTIAACIAPSSQAQAPRKHPQQNIHKRFDGDNIRGKRQRPSAPHRRRADQDLSPSRKANLFRLRKHFDRDGDGTLDQTERQALRKKLSKRFARLRRSHAPTAPQPKGKRSSKGRSGPHRSAADRRHVQHLKLHNKKAQTEPRSGPPRGERGVPRHISKARKSKARKSKARKSKARKFLHRRRHQDGASQQRPRRLRKQPRHARAAPDQREHHSPAPAKEEHLRRRADDRDIVR